MAEGRVGKRLKSVRDIVGEPIKLSEIEKEKFQKAFDQIKELMDENLELVLKMDRDEAYLYLNLMLKSFEDAEKDFVDRRQRRTLSLKPRGPDREDEPGGPVEKPDFEAILDKLTPEEREKAENLLACVKQYFEIGDEIVCSDCSVERIRACMRSEDPSISEPLTALREEAESLGPRRD